MNIGISSMIDSFRSRNVFNLLSTKDCLTETSLRSARMKVWIDVLTPKHALFFEPLYRDLARDGHQLLLTTRIYREAQEALELKRLRFRVVGEHGGASRYGKLLASGRRVVKLAQLIESWRPDTAVSFSSPEAARVAFGLGVPHVAVNDSPHSWLVARLSIPLSRYVCSPWIIRRRVWLSFGAWPDGIVAYRALDAAVWLKRHKPNPAVLKQLSLNRDKPIILLRTEESFASYLERNRSTSSTWRREAWSKLFDLPEGSRYWSARSWIQKKNERNNKDEVRDFYMKWRIRSRSFLESSGRLGGRPRISPGRTFPRSFRYPPHLSGTQSLSPTSCYHPPLPDPLPPKRYQLHLILATRNSDFGRK